MKNAVCVLITDKDKNILSVSRKDNHNDWGCEGKNPTIKTFGNLIL